MSDERLEKLNGTPVETAKEIDTGKDWELAVEALNATMLEETPKLTDLIRQHYTDLGNRAIEIREHAAASGEEKKLRSFMRREMKASYRKDIEIGCKLVEWERNIDNPEYTEDALQTIFSEVGLGVGLGLLSKLPDTYGKPNVRATDTERRRRVAITILDELVNDVTQANETDPKNDLVVARVGNLIKTFTLPEIGDRVEFDKTMRGVVVEHVDGEGEALDGAIVRIDNSGEEKLVLRGQKKFTEEPIARLHEAAIVRGDNSELYGQTVVVQNYEPGDSEQVEALRLDGTVVKLPAKDLVRAKPKDAKVVGDLLHLVSEQGHLDKIKLAVERAEKPLLKQIDELRATAEVSYGDGQIFAASRLSEVQPEVFVGAFTAMPSDKQAIVLSQIVPKAAPQPLDSGRAIEIQGGRSDAEIGEVLIAKYAGGECDRSALTPEEAGEAVDLLANVASEPAPEQPIAAEILPGITPETNEAPPVEVEMKAVAERFADTSAVEDDRALEILESKLAPEAAEEQVEVSAPVEISPIEVKAEQDVEPKLPLDLIESSEKYLLDCFNDYFAKRESALPTVGASAHSIFAKAIAQEAGVKNFLSHSTGKYFLMAIATGPWGGIRNDIALWGVSNPDAVRDRIDATTEEGLKTETELFEAINFFKDGNKKALKSVDDRIKKAAQATLTKKEKAAMLKKAKALETASKGSSPNANTAPEVSAVHPTVRASANIGEIRDWLLTTTFFQSAVGLIEGYELKIEEIISSEELHNFAKQSPEKASHAAQILKTLDREDYLNTPISIETKASAANAPVIREESNNNEDEEISW